METGILHCAYIEYYCGIKAVQQYLQAYIKAHEGLHPIIFLLIQSPKSVGSAEERTTFSVFIGRE